MTDIVWNRHICPPHELPADTDPTIVALMRMANEHSPQAEAIERALHIIAKQSAEITRLQALVEEMGKALNETAEYLRKLEANMLENDADMMLDDCLPPSFHADAIDATLAKAKKEQS